MEKQDKPKKPKAKPETPAPTPPVPTAPKKRAAKKPSAEAPVPPVDAVANLKITPDIVEAKFDPVTAVVEKYRAKGWNAFSTAPRKGTVDIVAKRDEVKDGKVVAGKSKYHFVQVMTDDNINDARFNGEPKNAFIQNAFSNEAAPIVAYVTRVNHRAADGTKTTEVKVTFKDVNSNARVLV